MNLIKSLILIFIIALLPRILWFTVKGNSLDIAIPAGTDAIGYDQIACNILNNNEYSFELGKPTAYREPVYPLFLAGIYVIFGHSYNAVRLVQIVISAFTCVLIFLFVYENFGKGAEIASLIACFYPYFIYYSTTILRETLFIYFLLYTVYLLTRVINKRETSLLEAGVCCGICCLINTTSIIFVVISLIVIFCSKYRKEAMMISFICLLVYAPWVIRNYKVFHTVILGSNVIGGTLYYANTIDYNICGTDKEIEFWKKDKIKNQSLTMSEVDSNRFLLKNATNIIISNPKEYVLQCYKRFIKLYRIYPHTGKGYVHSENLMVTCSLLSYGIILPFAILGLALSFKQYKKSLILYIAIFSFTLVYTLIWSVIRYRLPIEPYIIIFSTLGIIYLGDRNEKIKSWLW